MIYIGKIVSTHGIKGELRIVSDFEYKDKVTLNIKIKCLYLIITFISEKTLINTK